MTARAVGVKDVRIVGGIDIVVTLIARKQMIVRRCRGRVAQCCVVCEHQIQRFLFAVRL